MLLTLLPNPSLDKVLIVPGFAGGGAFHAQQVLPYAGGKGFHFARALRTLGGAAQVLAPLGGETGWAVARLAAGEGLLAHAAPVSGETRSGLVILDPLDGRITELYEPGPPLAEVEWERVMEKAISLLGQSEGLAVCGSFPPGVPEGGLARLVSAAHSLGKPVLLDSYGEPLRLALAARPALVKINAHEAGELVEGTIVGPVEALRAAARIRTLGAQSVVITLGPAGATGIDAGGRTFAWSAPPVERPFTPGSGDSFFAGLAFALGGGASLAEAARWGAAAGSANALSLGPGVFTREQVEELLAQVVERPGSMK